MPVDRWTFVVSELMLLLFRRPKFADEMVAAEKHLGPEQVDVLVMLQLKHTVGLEKR